jgi:hypothetical protein
MSSKEEDAEYEKYKRGKFTFERLTKTQWLKQRRETEQQTIQEAKARADYEALSIPEKIAFKEKSKEEDAEYEKYKKRYTLTADPKPVWLKRERETKAKTISEAKARADYEALSIPEKIAFKEKQIEANQKFIDNLVEKAEERGKYNYLEPDLISKFQTDIKLLQLEIRELKPVKPPPVRTRVVEKPVEEPKLLWINEPLAVYENIFIQTTHKGVFEIENVKGNMYIPEIYVVGKYKEISPKDLDDDFLQLKELDSAYYIAVPPITITLDKKSPYYFKTIGYENDTPIYIKLGKLKRKDEIQYYILKKDIQLDEFDAPFNPYGAKYFENDDFTNEKWKKYVKSRELGTKGSIKELSAYEGVSKKTEAEKEIAKLLQKPEKSKKDKPLSVIDVLERLPIPGGEKKKDISQLKKFYKKQQLEESPDTELVKELIKVLPTERFSNVSIEL